MLGFSGREVRRRRYWSSNTMGDLEVSNSTSRFDLRVTVKLKGFCFIENSRVASPDDTELLASGVGNTLVGT